jgi:putative protein-disulfide isomerase
LSSEIKLVYAHDPMCSWCWGFDKVFTQLQQTLPGSVELTRLLGGLALDSSEPMPGEMQTYLQQTWKTIEKTIPGTRFNHDFWTACQPRRSTWPACRAVIAARMQGIEFDHPMTNAIQRGYYLEAKNPSDDATLIEIAERIGLDRSAFSRELNSETTQQKLALEMRLSRQLGVRGFPSLVLLTAGSVQHIEIDYNDASKMLDQIQSGI